MTKTTNTFKSFLRNNIVQAIVIILSVLLSFYLEQRRQVNITKQEKNYLLVNGSVPGNKGNIVQVQSAVKVNQ